MTSKCLSPKISKDEVYGTIIGGGKKSSDARVPPSSCPGEITTPGTKKGKKSSKDYKKGWSYVGFFRRKKRNDRGDMTEISSEGLSVLHPGQPIAGEPGGKQAMPQTIMSPVLREHISSLFQHESKTDFPCIAVRMCLIVHTVAWAFA